MTKNILVVAFTLTVFFLISAADVFAIGIGKHGPCSPNNNPANDGCDKDLSLFCKPFQADPTRGSCEVDVFGQIQAPDALKAFLGTDPTGAGAISKFLSNLVNLIFSIAMIVLIFILLWGAFDWMTSGGDKEKIAAARSKIIHAVVGIMLFAAAFAVIAVLGTFTGFKFFEGQK